MMHVISSVDAWDELAPRWRALVASAKPTIAPFVAPEFARAWWSVFGNGGGSEGGGESGSDGARDAGGEGGDEGPEPAAVEFNILPVEAANGELVGVLPLARNGGSAAWLGDHEVADYMGPVAATGHERQVVEALFDHLEQSGATSADLRGLDSNAVLVDLLGATAQRRGWRAALSEEAICPVVDLEGGWDAYLERLRSRDRREVRRKLRPLRTLRSAVSLDVLQEPDEIAAQLPRFMAMMSGSRGDKAVFLTPQMERFFVALGAAMSQHGWLRLYRLSVSREPAAMILCWETHDELMLYNSGFDARFRDLNVGLASKVLCLRDAAERGLRRVNFLRGDEPYKFELGGRPTAVQRLQLQRAD